MLSCIYEEKKKKEKKTIETGIYPAFSGFANGRSTVFSDRSQSS